MTYEFYKVLHFVGIFLVVMALGALALAAEQTGSKNFPQRRFLSVMHGLGLLIAFIAGFGLMAKTGIARPPWPVWVHGKMVIWLVLGMFMMPIYRKPQLGKAWWMTVLLIAVLASYLARFKPF